MATRTTTKKKVADEPELLVPSVPLSPEELQTKIAARAFEIYLARNGSPGDATSDWLMAEHEICGALTASTPYADNVVPITSVKSKTKRTSSTKSTPRRSSTPKTTSQTRTRKQKEAKE
ncbi:MAG: DUF2934 domain-containing protein [Acidobacteria bacterium]|nr:DUF2934 domain-containing protein [Acidobacteriota bacterium]